MDVLIHDLGKYPFQNFSDDLEVIDTQIKAAPCQGCFKCWTQNAGYRVYADAFQHSGAAVLTGRRRKSGQRWGQGGRADDEMIR